MDKGKSRKAKEGKIDRKEKLKRVVRNVILFDRYQCDILFIYKYTFFQIIWHTQPKLVAQKYFLYWHISFSKLGTFSKIDMYGTLCLKNWRIFIKYLFFLLSLDFDFDLDLV